MDRPLTGFKVVELAMWVAGPSTAAVLGDWGADIIKLENPQGGRSYSRHGDPGDGKSQCASAAAV